MIIISSSVVLSDALEFPLSHPVIGWHNVATISNLTATEEEEGFPVSNLANPSTYLKWFGETATEQYIEITLPTGEFDYIGVAGHNFGTQQIAVSVESFVGFDSPPSSPPDEVWEEIVEDAIPADDKPIIFRFELASYTRLRVRLQAGDGVPFAAVMYVGKLLVMERSVPATSRFTPFPHGLDARIVNGVGESGTFLGRIVTHESQMAEVSFEYMRASWYRTNVTPFLENSVTKPFFFAWEPESYPQEVGFAWLETPLPKPEIDATTGRLHLTLPMTGISR